MESQQSPYGVPTESRESSDGGGIGGGSLPFEGEEVRGGMYLRAYHFKTWLTNIYVRDVRAH